MDRGGIFEGNDPMAIVGRWLNEAEGTEPNDPGAMALATVDVSGLPNVRMVLLKGIENGAFVFYTNYGSVKARELRNSERAAFVLHWKSLRRQVRVRGAVTVEDGAAADRYFATRAVQSRVGAWASRQSQPLSSRKALMVRAAKMGVIHGLDPKRPPFWGGFGILPVEIELWADGEFRLHDRFRWTRASPAAAWEVERLYP
ncbi:MAG: pyridoxamine 5'-phosphate oxidase [Boseongicola sp. SB0677_bin_26]|nr:pyridoxamine 5'-phosphate oxidase [Boseongicola sp. SB0665_bin_10]MYG28318.1 pyridoxamine 5'-phosphate oxidase [Boseongicola sp. SB0677_bin_26]